MAVLRQDVFRRVYTGSFLSNIGTWMQNVVLGALAYDLTSSSSFVGVVLFAHLGTSLLFSLESGMLDDHFDRRCMLHPNPDPKWLRSPPPPAVITPHPPPKNHFP